MALHLVWKNSYSKAFRRACREDRRVCGRLPCLGEISRAAQRKSASCDCWNIFTAVFHVFLTWLVYRGFHLEGTGAFSVLWLQAAVYIAVDMLPIPGAQGITELMYKSVFATVFPVNLLMPSMLAVRGLNFYLLLVISLVVVLWNLALGKRA